MIYFTIDGYEYTVDNSGLCSEFPYSSRLIQLLELWRYRESVPYVKRVVRYLLQQSYS